MDYNRFPLSRNQMRYIWAELGTPYSYMVSVYYPIQGELDLKKLKKSIERVMERHTICKI